MCMCGGAGGGVWGLFGKAWVHYSSANFRAGVWSHCSLDVDDQGTRRISGMNK